MRIQAQLKYSALGVIQMWLQNWVAILGSREITIMNIYVQIFGVTYVRH